MSGVFNRIPLNDEVFLGEDEVLAVVQYAESSDPATDRSNADTELKKKLRLLDSTYTGTDRNGGILDYYAASGSPMITAVAVGDGSTKHPAVTGYTELATDIVVTTNGWEASASVRTVIPVLIYQGNEVPLSDLSYMGDGQSTGCKVIIVNNTSGKYSAATPGDWKVTLHGFVRGLVSHTLGGVDLPITKTQIKVMGVSDQVSVTRLTKDGEKVSFNFVILDNKSQLRVLHGAGSSAPAEILNSPGEELAKAIYGSSWTAGAQNRIQYLPAGKKLAVAKLKLNSDVQGGLKLHTATAADQNKVFAEVEVAYSCELSKYDEQNPSAGSNDPSKIQVDYECNGGVWKKVYLTAA